MASPYVCAVCGNAVTLGRHESGWRHKSEGHYDHKVIKIARSEYRVTAEHTRVAIVYSDIGAQLPELADRFHVWVVDTLSNRRAAEALWAVGPGDRTHGVTTFKRSEGESTEASVVDLLPVVDEHHGLRTDWADDIVLEVIGQPLTDGIRAALEALGSFSISERQDGFTATRTPAV
jgi:hypothetical protein